MPQPSHPAVAIGPAMPGRASWERIAPALLEGLSEPFTATPFQPWELPQADAVVIVKQTPPPGWVAEVANRSAVVYCPLDNYADPTEIEAHADWLKLCSRIVVHCRRLEPYFRPFARTAYLDHPLQYATPTRRSFRPAGPLLWVGARANIAPLVAGVNAHPLPALLVLLIRTEQPGQLPGTTHLAGGLV